VLRVPIQIFMKCNCKKSIAYQTELAFSSHPFETCRPDLNHSIYQVDTKIVANLVS